MLLSALSLALGALSFALPVASLGTGAAVAVCFSPEEDCASFAVDAIDGAETQILVNAYGLTTSSRTVGALVRAKQRGVDVRLIADRTTPCGHNSGIDPLARAAYNSENLNLVASPTIAAAYAGHWHQRLALSLPYTQR